MSYLKEVLKTPQNRSEKRFAAAVNKSNPQINLRGRYGKVLADLNSVGLEWDQVVKESNFELATIVFQGKPFIFRCLEVRRSLANFLDKTSVANLRLQAISHQDFDHFNQIDMFSYKVRGTSLLDIEKMEFANHLSLADIQKINQIFLKETIIDPRRFLKKDHQMIGEIRQSILYFTTQPYARPEEKIRIPHVLRPLHQRFTDYFDYYTSLMIDSSLPLADELSFIKALGKGVPWLPQSLGCYIPARLGITPSSALKLYEQHFGYIPKFLSEKVLLRWLRQETSKAFRLNAFPADLERFQHRDEQADQIVESLLRVTYGGISGESQQSAEAEVENGLKELQFYNPDLLSTIHDSKGKRLVIDLPEHPLLSTLTLTSQNKSTLVCVLGFKDRDTHLTVEVGSNIDKENLLVYGFPPKLATENPHMQSVIFLSVLKPILAEAARRNTKKEVLPLPPPFVPAVWQQAPYIPQPKEKTVRPHLTILTPIAEVLSQKQTLPPRPEISKRQYFVQHSQAMIIDHLGKKVPERIVDQIMSDIKDFEFGRSGKTKQFHQEIGGFVQIRSGNYRILLSRGEKGRFFVVDKVVNRRDIGALKY